MPGPPLRTPLGRLWRAFPGLRPCLRTRRFGRRALLCAGLAGGAAGAWPAVAGAGLAEVQADLSRQLRLAGPRSSAYVYDLTHGKALFTLRTTAQRPPASVEKLYTATAVLE